MYNQVLKQLIDREVEFCSVTAITLSGSLTGLGGQKLLIGKDEVFYIADQLKERIPVKGLAWTKLLQLGEISMANQIVVDVGISLDNGMTGRFFIEPVLPESQLVIFGAGHIARPLAQLATLVNLKTIIYDDRPDLANPAYFPQPHKILCDGFDRLANYRLIKPKDSVVVATRGHKQDLTCLKHTLNHRCSYVGMVSSRRRAIEVKELLKEEGYREEQLASVFAPIGLAIGAVTPAEIAISIMAEIIKHNKPGKIGDILSSFQGQDQHIKAENRDPQAFAIFEQVASGSENHGTEELAMATVISTSGSTPRKAGAKMLISSTGETFGTIGGGCGEAQVKTAALQVLLDHNQPFLTKVSMSNDVAADEGMMCGGNMEVFIEPLEMRANG